MSNADEAHQKRELNNLRSSKKTLQLSRTKTSKNSINKSHVDTSQNIGINRNFNLFAKKKSQHAKVDLIKIRSNLKNAIRMIDSNLDNV